MDQSSVPHQSIQQLMPNLLSKINNSEVIKSKLFQINFRTSGIKVLATLIYHKSLQEEWVLAAKNIQDSIENLFIIGRSKKQKVLISEEDFEMVCS